MRLLCMLLLAWVGGAHGNEVKQDAPTVSAWIFAIYSAPITESKTRVFFDTLGRFTDVTFEVRPSTDVSALIAECPSGEPQIVIASLPTAEAVAAHCGYGLVAVSTQDIYLFIKNEQDFSQLELLKVGVLRGIQATVVAKKELPRVSQSYQMQGYENLYDLIKREKDDHINAVVLPMVVVNAASGFSKRWKPVYQFESKGVAAIAVSPTMDKALIEKLEMALLNEDQVLSKLWMEALGLGPLRSPEVISKSAE